jgi:hypothetical protein
MSTLHFTGWEPELPCMGLGEEVRGPASLSPLTHILLISPPYNTPLVDGAPGARGSSWLARSRARPMALNTASMM